MKCRSNQNFGLCITADKRLRYASNYLRNFFYPQDVYTVALDGNVEIKTIKGGDKYG
ncbi:MAG: hypothetical protein J7K36_11065 [Archaeoglobaceae archaeon]|nr:hypothetical protein [Archaeoglobaceae archaeon]